MNSDQAHQFWKSVAFSFALVAYPIGFEIYPVGMGILWLPILPLPLFVGPDAGFK